MRHLGVCYTDIHPLNIWLYLKGGISLRWFCMAPPLTASLHEHVSIINTCTKLFVANQQIDAFCRLGSCFLTYFGLPAVVNLWHGKRVHSLVLKCYFFLWLIMDYQWHVSCEKLGGHSDSVRSANVAKKESRKTLNKSAPFSYFSPCTNHRSTTT